MDLENQLLTQVSVPDTVLKAGDTPGVPKPQALPQQLIQLMINSHRDVITRTVGTLGEDT